MNCCGTEDYEDWFATAFGNGTDVPDSCCLLISEGCGKDIKNDVSPEDDIETEVSCYEGCCQEGNCGVTISTST